MILFTMSRLNSYSKNWVPFSNFGERLPAVSLPWPLSRHQRYRGLCFVVTLGSGAGSGFGFSMGFTAGFAISGAGSAGSSPGFRTTGSFSLITTTVVAVSGLISLASAGRSGSGGGSFTGTVLGFSFSGGETGFAGGVEGFDFENPEMRFLKKATILSSIGQCF